MSSQSFTFFFTTDLHRATDRSQQTSWSSAPTSSSAPVATCGWAKPAAAR
jgi:hypothetical protein